MTNLDKARWLSLLIPVSLLAGAYGSEMIGGLHPCEMCWWQRYPHFAAIPLALIAFLLARGPDKGRSFVWLAALTIALSGAIGVYHAGVEWGFFEGITTCSAGGTAGASNADILADIMATPLVRCDEVQWTFLGLSLAGWNALISLGAAGLILWLSLRRPMALA
ncbi:disulfide bond formation protein B [Allosphingosinicella vermicomposti]|uniref:disulfide bond formation protein B n=1 Tax=Allosphingosinicella vermicomposti TaxID=614671 RepID=UPI000D0EB5FC|nr:disulfide bond formation protein B [Allosphingosinicella vermicomposti]